MENRVISGIAEAKKNIESRLEKGLVTQEKIDELSKALDMDMTMYSDFQNRKSIASMDGRLSFEEAQTIYTLIGETPTKFNSLPIHNKIVLTQIYSELLKN
jgi:hypothetical protein